MSGHETTNIVKSEERGVGLIRAATIEELTEHVGIIQKVLEKVMIKDEHYGVIPGCGKKPSLLKAGAEKIAMTFRLDPEYEIEPEDLPNGHRGYETKCIIYSIETGKRLGSGVGYCSTMESKYRFRTGEKELTDVQVPRAYWDTRDSDPTGAMKVLQEAAGESCKLSTGKGEDGRWYIGKAGEKVEHDNPADYFNTAKKMSKKRAYVDAVLTVTAASDIFTQDVEDMNIGGSSHDQQSSGGNGQRGVEAGISDPQRRKIYAMCKEHGLGNDEAKRFYHAELGEKPTIKGASDLIEHFADRLKAFQEKGCLSILGQIEDLSKKDPMTAEILDKMWELCDPKKLIETDDDYDEFVRGGKLSEAAMWIVKAYQVREAA